jgi:hypothetical protein
MVLDFVEITKALALENAGLLPICWCGGKIARSLETRASARFSAALNFCVECEM